MSAISRLVLNLSIAAKLGIASGLSILLVFAMMISQSQGNIEIRDADARKSAQQTIATDTVDFKASMRGMQIGVRDLRLATSPTDLQKASDYLASRLKSADQFADDILKLSHGENRARIEKLRTIAADYARGAGQIAAVRGEMIAAAGGGAEAAAKVAKLNEEAVRIAREVTLPIASEIEALANQVIDFAKKSVEEQTAQSAQHMASVERTSMIVGLCTALLLIGTTVFSFFTIARPMRRLSVSMEELAGGNFAVVLPGLGRKDELGAVAGAVEKFKVVRNKSPRRGRSQDPARSDRSSAAQGRDGQAGRFL